MSSLEVEQPIFAFEKDYLKISNLFREFQKEEEEKKITTCFKFSFFFLNRRNVRNLYLWKNLSLLLLFLLVFFEK